ncbi:uncharacterized protein LOC119681838 [Teleopsis dalmanni]|uniref:uncharacterized protein LOC119681838 n=1 Tax=Teleopsis dalmanni TaxID=139649 RepID=UPI0018CFDB13|nr:uncharacterized protein LOC119681838 [Teleopsis dalmanni]
MCSNGRIEIQQSQCHLTCMNSDCVPIPKDNCPELLNGCVRNCTESHVIQYDPICASCNGKLELIENPCILNCREGTCTSLNSNTCTGLQPIETDFNSCISKCSAATGAVCGMGRDGTFKVFENLCQLDCDADYYITSKENCPRVLDECSVLCSMDKSPVCGMRNNQLETFDNECIYDCHKESYIFISNGACSDLYATSTTSALSTNACIKTCTHDYEYICALRNDGSRMVYKNKCILDCNADGYVVQPKEMCRDILINLQSECPQEYVPACGDCYGYRKTFYHRCILETQIPTCTFISYGTCDNMIPTHVSGPQSNATTGVTYTTTTTTNNNTTWSNYTSYTSTNYTAITTRTSTRIAKYRFDQCTSIYSYQYDPICALCTDRQYYKFDNDYGFNCRSRECVEVEEGYCPEILSLCESQCSNVYEPACGNCRGQLETFDSICHLDCHEHRGCEMVPNSKGACTSLHGLQIESYPSVNDCIKNCSQNPKDIISVCTLCTDGQYKFFDDRCEFECHAHECFETFEENCEQTLKLCESQCLPNKIPVCAICNGVPETYDNRCLVEECRQNTCNPPTDGVCTESVIAASLPPFTCTDICSNDYEPICSMCSNGRIEIQQSQCHLTCMNSDCVPIPKDNCPELLNGCVRNCTESHVIQYDPICASCNGKLELIENPCILNCREGTCTSLNSNTCTGLQPIETDFNSCISKCSAATGAVCGMGRDGTFKVFENLCQLDCDADYYIISKENCPKVLDECSVLCSMDKSPVCGMRNNQLETFDNECIYDCHKESYIFISNGACSDLYATSTTSALSTNACIKTCTHDYEYICALRNDGSRMVYKNKCIFDCYADVHVMQPKEMCGDLLPNLESECPQEFVPACGDCNGDRKTFNHRCNLECQIPPCTFISYGTCDNMIPTHVSGPQSNATTGVTYTTTTTTNNNTTWSNYTSYTSTNYTAITTRTSTRIAKYRFDQCTSIYSYQYDPICALCTDRQYYKFDNDYGFNCRSRECVEVEEGYCPEILSLCESQCSNVYEPACGNCRGQLETFDSICHLDCHEHRGCEMVPNSKGACTSLHGLQIESYPSVNDCIKNCSQNPKDIISVCTLCTDGQYKFFDDRCEFECHAHECFETFEENCEQTLKLCESQCLPNKIPVCAICNGVPETYDNRCLVEECRQNTCNPPTDGVCTESVIAASLPPFTCTDICSNDYEPICSMCSNGRIEIQQSQCHLTCMNSDCVPIPKDNCPELLNGCVRNCTESHVIQYDPICASCNGKLELIENPCILNCREGTCTSLNSNTCTGLQPIETDFNSCISKCSAATGAVCGMGRDGTFKVFENLCQLDCDADYYITSKENCPKVLDECSVLCSMDKSPVCGMRNNQLETFDNECIYDCHKESYIFISNGACSDLYATSTTSALSTNACIKTCTHDYEYICALRNDGSRMVYKNKCIFDCYADVHVMQPKEMCGDLLPNLESECPQEFVPACGDCNGDRKTFNHRCNLECQIPPCTFISYGTCDNMIPTHVSGPQSNATTGVTYTTTTTTNNNTTWSNYTSYTSTNYTAITTRTSTRIAKYRFDQCTSIYSYQYDPICALCTDRQYYKFDNDYGFNCRSRECVEVEEGYCPEILSLCESQCSNVYEPACGNCRGQLETFDSICHLDCHEHRGCEMVPNSKGACTSLHGLQIESYPSVNDCIKNCSQNPKDIISVCTLCTDGQYKFFDDRCEFECHAHECFETFEENCEQTLKLCESQCLPNKIPVCAICNGVPETYDNRCLVEECRQNTCNPPTDGVCTETVIAASLPPFTCTDICSNDYEPICSMCSNGRIEIQQSQCHLTCMNSDCVPIPKDNCPELLNGCVRNCSESHVIQYDPICASCNGKLELIENSCILNCREGTCTSLNSNTCTGLQPIETDFNSCISKCSAATGAVCGMGRDGTFKVFENLCQLDCDADYYIISKENCPKVLDECSVLCSMDKSPVCGMRNNQLETFDNECIYDCHKESYIFISNGACSDLYATSTTSALSTNACIKTCTHDYEYICALRNDGSRMVYKNKCIFDCYADVHVMQPKEMCGDLLPNLESECPQEFVPACGDCNGDRKTFNHRCNLECQIPPCTFISYGTCDNMIPTHVSGPQSNATTGVTYTTTTTTNNNTTWSNYTSYTSTNYTAITTRTSTRIAKYRFDQCTSIYSYQYDPICALCTDRQYYKFDNDYGFNCRSRECVEVEEGYCPEILSLCESQCSNVYEPACGNCRGQLETFDSICHLDCHEHRGCEMVPNSKGACTSLHGLQIESYPSVNDCIKNCSQNPKDIISVCTLCTDGQYKFFDDRCEFECHAHECFETFEENCEQTLKLCESQCLPNKIPVCAICNGVPETYDNRCLVEECRQNTCNPPTDGVCTESVIAASLPPFTCTDICSNDYEPICSMCSNGRIEIQQSQCHLTCMNLDCVPIPKDNCPELLNGCVRNCTESHVIQYDPICASCNGKLELIENPCILNCREGTCTSLNSNTCTGLQPIETDFNSCISKCSAATGAVCGMGRDGTFKVFENLCQLDCDADYYITSKENCPKVLDECSVLCSMDKSPVCGMRNNQLETFDNECIYDCHKESYIFISNGACSDLYATSTTSALSTNACIKTCTHDYEYICALRNDGSRMVYKNKCIFDCYADVHVMQPKEMCGDLLPNLESECPQEFVPACGERYGERKTFNHRCNLECQIPKYTFLSYGTCEDITTTAVTSTDLCRIKCGYGAAPICGNCNGVMETFESKCFMECDAPTCEYVSDGECEIQQISTLAPVDCDIVCKDHQYIHEVCTMCVDNKRRIFRNECYFNCRGQALGCQQEDKENCPLILKNCKANCNMVAISPVCADCGSERITLENECVLGCYAPKCVKISDGNCTITTTTASEPCIASCGTDIDYVCSYCTDGRRRIFKNNCYFGCNGAALGCTKDEKKNCPAIANLESTTVITTTTASEPCIASCGTDTDYVCSYCTDGKRRIFKNNCYFGCNGAALGCTKDEKKNCPAIADLETTTVATTTVASEPCIASCGTDTDYICSYCTDGKRRIFKNNCYFGCNGAALGCTKDEKKNCPAIADLETTTAATTTVASEPCIASCGTETNYVCSYCTDGKRRIFKNNCYFGCNGAALGCTKDEKKNCPAIADLETTTVATTTVASEPCIASCGTETNYVCSYCTDGKRRIFKNNCYFGCNGAALGCTKDEKKNCPAIADLETTTAATTTVASEPCIASCGTETNYVCSYCTDGKRRIFKNNCYFVCNGAALGCTKDEKKNCPAIADLETTTVATTTVASEPCIASCGSAVDYVCTYCTDGKRRIFKNNCYFVCNGAALGCTKDEKKNCPAIADLETTTVATETCVSSCGSVADYVCTYCTDGKRRIFKNNCFFGCNGAALGCTKDEKKNCPAITDLETTTPAQTACGKECPTTENQVCGVCGKEERTFKNLCLLNKQNCETQQCTFKSQGACSCVKVCPTTTAQVCATCNGQNTNFRNMCMLENRNCGVDKCILQHSGACKPAEVDPCTRVCPDVSSPVCAHCPGKRINFKNMCAYQKWSCQNKGCTKVTAGVCQATDPCIKACPNTISTVCGLCNGQLLKFENQCEFDIKNCQMGHTCHQKPELICKLIQHFEAKLAHF